VSFTAITLSLTSQRVFIAVFSLSTQSGNFWINTRMFVWPFAIDDVRDSNQVAL
jgi:hypothetical protein